MEKFKANFNFDIKLSSFQSNYFLIGFIQVEYTLEYINRII
jgi:hypothetical protein